MPTKKKPSAHSTVSDTAAAVDAFMSKLKHPAKAEVEVLRSVITKAHSTILEGIKWNSPSFRTTEYFATTNLRTKSGIGVVLHFGAKVRTKTPNKNSIADPKGLLTWVAADRATLSFKDRTEILAKQSAIQALIRQWISFV